MLGRVVKKFFSTQKPAVKVSVTGGSGNISYSLLTRIASGELFGPDQPIELQILDLPQMQDALKGVTMELDDCAFPLLQNIVATDSLDTAFQDADYAFLVGSRPRGPGMERADLLKLNGEIFKGVGNSLSNVASRDVKVVVVGNPANTNALICMANAPNIPKENFAAMTRLDHNRALTQLALRTFSTVNDVKKFCIWGNHSSTMYPDISYSTVKGNPAADQVEDNWVKTEFLQGIQQRGALIIKARKSSSAASAGNAAMDTIRDWTNGSNGDWVSMGVLSDQFDGAYGIPNGIMFSYPLITANGKYELVKGLELSEYSKEMIKITADELLAEREAVEHLL